MSYYGLAVVWLHRNIIHIIFLFYSCFYYNTLFFDRFDKNIVRAYTGNGWKNYNASSAMVLLCYCDFTDE